MDHESTRERPARGRLHETAFWLVLALPAAACAAPGGSAGEPLSAAPALAAPAAAEPGAIELEPRRRCPGSRTPLAPDELATTAAQPAEAAAALRARGRCSPR